LTAAALSSLLYCISFPGTWLSLVVFVSLVPLFYAIERARDWRQAAARGFLYGALFGLGLAYWIFIAVRFHYEASLFFSLLFVLLPVPVPLGVLFALFAIVYRYFRRDSAVFYLAVLPSLWVIFEYIREVVPLFLPWGLAGYSMAGFPRFAQAADLGGLYLVSFLVVMINASLYRIFDGFTWADMKSLTPKETLIFLRAHAVKRRVYVVSLACAVILPLIYGSVMLARWDASVRREIAEGRGIAARIVQPNLAHRERWEERSVFHVLQSCVGLTGEPDTTERIIVWPETVLNIPPRLRTQVLAAVAGLAGERGIVIFGGTRSDVRGVNYNSAYLVSGSGSVRWYAKILLLPFAETAPFGINFFGWFSDAPAVFGKGALPTAVRTDRGVYGLSICFEKIFGWFVRESVRRGAEVLVNISNDTWFGRSTMTYVHRDAAVMRAIENRRFVLLASNGGVSAVITPTGRITAQSRLFERERIDAAIVKVRHASVYSRAGDFPLYGSLVVLALAVAARLYRERGA